MSRRQNQRSKRTNIWLNPDGTLQDPVERLLGYYNHCKDKGRVQEDPPSVAFAAASLMIQHADGLPQPQDDQVVTGQETGYTYDFGQLQLPPAPVRPIKYRPQQWGGGRGPSFVGLTGGEIDLSRRPAN